MSYLLDNREPGAEDRFDTLSTLFDATTARHLDQIGVADGWRCWEVGAGGPSVPRLLAERAGPTGSVLATDLEPGQLTGALPATVTVRRHDVAHDDPPGGPGFDLVHARMVLMHVPERAAALRRMVGALRPGGWLLVEDIDCTINPLTSRATPPDDAGMLLADRVRAEFLAMLVERGADLAFGGSLPRVLRTAGLADVRADGFVPFVLPGCAALELINVRQLRAGMLARGRLTADELDRHLAAVAAGTVEVATPPLISAWGRRR